jgi:exoribonuclease R
MNSIEDVNQDFQSIRDSLQLPRDFSPAILEAASVVAQRTPSNAALKNLQNVPFITIDPPTSLDLDQAYWADRLPSGYRVRYAIADVGFWIDYGSDLEREAWRRGNTYYSPDCKTSLYPHAISEGAASLLPEQIRPAIVFDFELNERAEVINVNIDRSLVMSRAKLSYPDVGRHLDTERVIPGSGHLARQEWALSLTLLEEIGRKRQQLEIERRGISLRIPAQQVERWATALYGYRLAFEESTEVEDWNAQISLMTGISAAQVMISYEVGLLRTLDPPREDRLRTLRFAAQALRVNWPIGMRYDEFVRSLDPHDPIHSVMLQQAARVNGGAQYLMFDGKLPKRSSHAAIASTYAHVTAPLRRLADRYVLDLLVELSNGNQPSQELLDALYALPELMSESESRSHKLETAIVDFAEARLMQDHLGEKFSAIVIGLREDSVIVQIAEPPIRTKLPLNVFGDENESKLSRDGATLQVHQTEIVLGQTLSLSLIEADPVTRVLKFRKI